MEKKSEKRKVEHNDPFNSEREIAADFAMHAHKKFDKMIKASILFGSQAKKTATPSSDIDIVFIIDDVSIAWDLELISWYREELGKLIAASDYGRELHINTIKLSTWWNDLLYGDPVVINIIRYGEALIDSGGFFNPIKGLLQSGKIRSTHEAVYVSLERAPGHLLRSKMSKLSAIDGLYWCMVDSAQAALMTLGKIPPSPEHIPGLLQEELVSRGILKESYATAMKEMYQLYKGISHGAIHDIKSEIIDEWNITAESFMNEMIRIINQILDKENSK
ncbi:MAG: nucleotidyltransferase domain-containing protein [Nanoarchaeota archaeon]